MTILGWQIIFESETSSDGAWQRDGVTLPKIWFLRIRDRHNQDMKNTMAMIFFKWSWTVGWKRN